MTDCIWELVSSGLVLSCPALIKNTLCQDKQWPRIWWIFLSTDNEVQLTPIKLDWESATGLFQRQLRRIGWKPKPTLFAKEGENFLKKEPWEMLECPFQLGLKQRSQQQLMSLWTVMVFQKSSGSHSSFCKLWEPTTFDADISHQATWVLTEEVWHLQVIWKSI